jgi:hypothetical protein
MMDRREFFLKLCALSGSLVLPVGCNQDGGTASVGLPDGSTSTAVAFSKQSFLNTIDTVFSVTHDVYGVVDLQLNLVTDEIYTPEAEQFSISLSGPELPVLEEASYAVYNDDLGNIDLYIQPGESGNGQLKYIAVFSLLNT